MKGNIIVCSLLATMVVGDTGVWADSGNNAVPPNDKPCHCSEADHRMPPPPCPEMVIDHMTKCLKLTIDQQTKIKALFAKDREKTEPLQQKLMEYRKQVRDAMKSATLDENAIRSLAAKQAQAEVDLTVSMVRLRSQVNALLTPDQRVLADKFPPPFQHGRGPQPMRGEDRGPRSRCGNEEGPGHMPPMPCGDHRGHHPDDDFDGE